jgi:PAS domain S-box-containing protein
MTSSRNSAHISSFLVRFILPTILTMALFLAAFFSIIIPTIENNSLERKREMIRELTNSAWTILSTLENEVQLGRIDTLQAQRQAMDQIKNLHYGHEMKDYFWINDMSPRMVIHPYRPDLDGASLANYTDPDGKRIFIEMVKLVTAQGSGYVAYSWQWQDEEARIIPKLSYVKGFAPWGWIIGTGIYIDDVKAEIKTITNNLIKISLSILFIISLLLAFIASQSYKAMKKQQLAEKALRESEEKYRTLVESAAEGMVMSLEGTIMYANQPIADLLGYSLEELLRMETARLFLPSEDPGENNFMTLLLEGRRVPERFEAQIRSKNGNLIDITLSAAPISLGGKTGFMAVVSDITTRKKERSRLGASEEKFRSMVNNLNVGLFRISLGKNPRFIEANPALVQILGYPSKESLFAEPLLDLYFNRDDYKTLGHATGPHGLKREIVRFVRKDGSSFHAAIWGVRVLDKNGRISCFDGILEDISALVLQEERNTRLISQMQAALMYHNQRIGSLSLRPATDCPASTPIYEAIGMMEAEHAHALLVREADKITGWLSDQEIRQAISQKMPPLTTPVSAIMSSPIPTLPEQASVFEAWADMRHNRHPHLFITNSKGDIIGNMTGNDILAIQHYSPSVLLDAIRESSSPDELIRTSGIAPFLLTTLIESGVKPQNINSLTTQISDTILTRLIVFATQELGPPPTRFAFIVFGSVGREEQTLKTDQDNAIIFEDVPADQEPSVQKYFLALGKKVCTWMNAAGYTFCEGNNMAMNPEYCQPLSTWKQYFSRWIFSATAEDLLRIKIFFDFRTAYGDTALEDELRCHIEGIASENFRFFQMLARNILQMAPPIGLFGNFIVETSGPKRGAFEMKSAMMPIVDFARIYAIKNKIRAANTITRLDTLHELKILNDINHQEMIQAYTYLMQIRLRVHAKAIASGKHSPSNHVFPRSLTSIEQKLLKEIFSQTKNFQVKLSYDFTGQINNG